MKRIMDLGLLVLLMPLWVPLFLIVWLIVRIRVRRPVFFRQVRVGKDGQPFVMIKFRTMKNSQDSDGNLLPDEERLTRCGRILRSLSLDELPELLNVFRGEMSLVGPRPLPTAYLERYSREQARRHSVLPGITGWAQVNGRNALDWEARFRMDVWYVDNQSFWLDCRILAKTLLTVLSRKGIAAENSVTMHEFKGTQGNPGHKPPPA